MLLLGGFVALMSHAKELPVEDFFKRPSFDSVRISPTGEYLAARVEIKDRKSLVLMERATQKIIRVLNFGQKEDQEVGSFGWLGDDRIYAVMVKKLGPLDMPAGTGYMFAANVDGSKTIQIMPKATRAGGSNETPYGFSIIDMLEQDPEHIIISVWESAYPVAYKLDIYSGSRERLGRSPAKYGRFLTDSNGELKVAVGSDISKVKFYIKADGDDKWETLYEYDESEGGLRPIQLSADDKKMYLYSNETDTRNGIFEFDFESRSLTEIAKLDGDAEVFDYIYDNNYQHPNLLGVAQMPGYIEKTFVNDQSVITKTHKVLDDAFPGQFVRIVNYTKDGNTALVVVASDRNPGTVYTLDLKTFELKFLLSPRDWIKPDEMAAMQPVSFTARDGVEIRGYLTLPKDKSKNLPMVVVVHGGPYGPQDMWGFNAEAQFLANRGYAVLQINYRGSGGRGSKFQYSAYRKMGKEMQDDLTDGTLWAVEQGYADKDRMCIYGGSYGGYAALFGVVKEPDLYKCAIGYVGVYDIAIQPKLSDTAGSREGRQFLEDAWNAYDDAFVKERSALYHLDKLKAALFIVHGDDDARVPVENAHALTDALDKMNYPYELMIKDREGHGFYDDDNRIELYTRMAAFLDKHIGH